MPYLFGRIRKKYRTLVVDPPWPMRKINRKVRSRQGSFLDYPVMTLEEIEALDIDHWATRDAYCFLWTTQKFIKPAFGILEAWEFPYVCTITWCKPTGICPYNPFQFASEFVLFGCRDRKVFRQFRMGTVKTWFCTKGRPRHSEKPEQFYQMIRRITPEPRIDLFARRRHKGFDAWGNQVESG